MDNIAFYSDAEIKAWWEDFRSSPDAITIPGIPFSYYEIRNELLRRERMQDYQNYL